MSIEVVSVSEICCQTRRAAIEGVLCPLVGAPDCGTVPARVKRISTRGQKQRDREAIQQQTHRDTHFACSWCPQPASTSSNSWIAARGSDHKMTTSLRRRGVLAVPNLAAGAAMPITVPSITTQTRRP